MRNLPRLLICDDDLLFHMAVKQALKGKMDCKSAHHGDEALAILGKQPIDLVLLDVQMRTPDEGLKLIPKIKDLDPQLMIVMSSGITEFSTVSEAMRLGAADYVPKDFDPNELEHTLRLVLEKQLLLKRGDQRNFEVASTQRRHVLVGKSAAMDGLRKVVGKLLNSNANVVITGETGTGKEVVARQLRGTFPDGSLAPFVAIDSSTIQSSTAESILFGHEKGAFTGAERSVKGIFEEANGGIVYFDEIANMPLEIQAKLLRVLQEREVVRLGSSRPIELEFRVVCATNRDLEQMVKQGLFKDDLLQRLNVIPVAVPPLRERREDIPALLEHFLAVHSAGDVKLSFSADASALLQEYEWPGNIRELGNLVAFLIVMCEGPEIEVSDLPPKFRDRLPCSKKSEATTSSTTGQDFYRQVENFEASVLRQEYEVLGGNISKLAIHLGMDRSHLYSKLKQYKIHPKG